MSMTIYEARAQKAWRLVHVDKRPVKNAASVIGVSTNEIYEMLASWKVRLEAAERRRVSLAALSRTSAPYPKVEGQCAV